jgi:hypothetical protein
MIPWEQRSIEIASLFNPAFCSLILRQSIMGYLSEQSSGMPFPLSFLILPIVLHRNTREMLPGNITIKMHVWVNNRGEVKVQFPERCKRLAQFTREGLIYGMQGNLFSVNEMGFFIPSEMKIKLPWNKATESYKCARKAEFIGRWFAKAGEASTIFHMWGVRP